jgi:[CysO sulfur-carrier protein]-S-L-cysteine hydrolase
MKILQAVGEQLLGQARTESPLECCGYLAGTGDTISRAFPMENKDKSPVHYTFDPAEQFKVIKEIRKNNLHILGVYHSHPKSPASPSEEDIRLAYDPEIRYVIVSLVEGEKSVRCFTIIKGEVTEEELQLL